MGLFVISMQFPTEVKLFKPSSDSTPPIKRLPGIEEIPSNPLKLGNILPARRMKSLPKVVRELNPAIETKE